jgi:hypothetical protein
MEINSSEGYVRVEQNLYLSNVNVLDIQIYQAESSIFINSICSSELEII